MRNLRIDRQEAESLVDILEDPELDRSKWIAASTPNEVAGEIRKLFGMLPAKRYKFKPHVPSSVEAPEEDFIEYGNGAELFNHPRLQDVRQICGFLEFYVTKGYHEEQELLMASYVDSHWVIGFLEPDHGLNIETTCRCSGCVKRENDCHP
jgi:hypothetical protein